MKKVLITGENSYVGNSFAEWVKDDSEIYVEKLSLRDGTWRNKNFSKFDVVLHVAGIAHQKETKENEQLYYQVNRDITIKIAQMAKKDGVPHFVFLSSMSVYGMDMGVIDKNTDLNPKSYYGKSKFEAEKGLCTLESPTFKVAILRPPLIYGKGCKGNYVRLSKLAHKTLIFPKIANKRSMIYIDNLSMIVKKIILSHLSGLFFLQNKEYVSTSEMVQLIAEKAERKILMTKLFNPLLKLLIRLFGTLRKVFGDLVYSEKLSWHEEFNDIKFIDFKTSIELTEE
ncbi:NAD-dependent epimerase/dehydratase family protein [Oceanobacillus oncorhynchi subsp. oncorhynchi]|uniref:NAD-dependent epimerase/dehydratase family protein n=1 Tax=Oceanobacillus oncorhynchi TaxID=545501 RepID=UPI00363CAF52